MHKTTIKHCTEYHLQCVTAMIMKQDICTSNQMWIKTDST